MLLKYFYDEKIAHASYLVGCQATGEAIVIDPGRDIDPYVQLAEAQGMKIIAATETHIHADFVSGARELAERVGAKLYLSDEGDENWKYSYLEPYQHMLVKDGTTFNVGNIKFEVMHTPGHTPEHIAFVVTDAAKANEPMGIFTGDFVFVGDVGRPDLLEEAAGMADTAEPSARQMFASLARFKALPDYLQVWPAHGAGSACGKALGAIPSSTVGYEKQFNWALAYDDMDKFVKALLDGQPEAPRYFGMMKKLNKLGPSVLNGMPTPQQIDVDQLATILKTSAPVVDTRPSDVFATGHIPGTLNIPYDGAFTNWAGWLLDYDQPFYLIADEATIDQIAHDLAAIGLDEIGGFADLSIVKGWSSLEGYSITTPTEIAKQVADGDVTLVDVRNDGEWNAGHIPNAQHIMLGYLPQCIQDIPTNRPIVVQCQSGRLSSIGVSILQANGIANVTNLQGGYSAWAAADLLITRNGHR